MPKQQRRRIGAQESLVGEEKSASSRKRRTTVQTPNVETRKSSNSKLKHEKCQRSRVVFTQSKVEKVKLSKQKSRKRLERTHNPFSKLEVEIKRFMASSKNIEMPFMLLDPFKPLKVLVMGAGINKKEKQALLSVCKQKFPDYDVAVSDAHSRQFAFMGNPIDTQGYNEGTKYISGGCDQETVARR